MRKSTRGYCKYCSKEYTRTGMVKHLQTCKRRIDLYEKTTETEKYFELLLYGASKGQKADASLLTRGFLTS